MANIKIYESYASIFELALTVSEILTFQHLTFQKQVKVVEYNFLSYPSIADINIYKSPSIRFYCSSNHTFQKF